MHASRRNVFARNSLRRSDRALRWTVAARGGALGASRKDELDHEGLLDHVVAQREPMAEVADTATVIALIRSQESSVPPAERLFDDPYARLFSVGGAAAEEIAARFFTVPFFREAIRLRTRFIDDTVRAILADGLRQIVLLGAGFDCRTLRLADIANSGAAVFEIDFAPQLAHKRAVLEAAGVKLPDAVRFVPCDFTADDFETKLLVDLSADGFRPGMGTCFIWEGVVGYLDDAAVDRTPRFRCEGRWRGQPPRLEPHDRSLPARAAPHAPGGCGIHPGRRARVRRVASPLPPGRASAGRRAASARDRARPLRPLIHRATPAAVGLSRALARARSGHPFPCERRPDCAVREQHAAPRERVEAHRCRALPRLDHLHGGFRGEGPGPHLDLLAVLHNGPDAHAAEQ
jgi:methyltransferase (TIGR00027 family)